MVVNGQNLCIGCMKPLDDSGHCSCCHFDQDTYRPIPRCLLPGTVLAERYVLGRVLGEGSFGITYIGWDQILEHRVAIKEYYPSDLVSRDVIRGTDKNVYVYESKAKEEYQNNLDKFLNEARCLTRFNQLDGIVSVRDFFYENETAYIVMEYVSGMSVKEYIQQNGPMKGEQVLKLMKPVLETLSKVHKTGMVHRDISPDNILFSEDGELVLIDFGSARVRNMEMTRSMTIVFKRGYSPEEQYRARGHQGAWSDVYAICATMYFMLTAKTPEDAIERMIGAPMKSLTEMKDVALGVRQKEALMKGISIHARDRYENVERLMEVLYSEKSDIEPEQREKTEEMQQTNWLQRNWKKVLPAGIGMLALVVSVCFLTWGGNAQQESASVSGKHTPKATVIVTPTPEPVIYEMIECTHLTQKQAKEKLNQLADEKLTVKWDKKYSNTVKKGRVIKQSVEPGIQWKQGEKKTITLTISRGKKMVKVPDLTGLHYENAQNKLTQKNLNFKIVWEDSGQRDGLVLRQSKKAGSKVVEKTRITLTVSRYVAPTPVPTSKTPKENEDSDYAGVIS